MENVNWIAVLLCGISSMVIGGLWYSKLLFGPAWQAETGVTDEKAASANMGLVMGSAFVLSLIAAFVFAMFLGPNPGVKFGAGAGFAAGLFWVGASFGISYLFELRSLKLWVINSLYHTLQFTAFGAILGLMGS